MVDFHIFNILHKPRKSQEHKQLSFVYNIELWKNFKALNNK